MTARPLIGLTTSEIRRAGQVTPRPEGEPAMHEMALGLKYARSIELAGGLPVVLPPMDLDAVPALLAGLAGVCLSGGPDLDPASYGEEAHPSIGPVETDLDYFELAVASEAQKLGMPLLAICRGAQALNVARGGTLVQHLPDRGGDIEHRQTPRGDVATHHVDVEPGSLLEAVVGRRRLSVNSFHHQAVHRLGRGLHASATAPDGVVEAIEARGEHFVLGVQWHAETLAERPEHGKLFEALVAASSGYQRIGRLHAA